MLIIILIAFAFVFVTAIIILISTMQRTKNIFPRRIFEECAHKYCPSIADNSILRFLLCDPFEPICFGIHRFLNDIIQFYCNSICGLAFPSIDSKKIIHGNSKDDFTTMNRFEYTKHETNRTVIKS